MADFTTTIMVADASHEDGEYEMEIGVEITHFEGGRPAKLFGPPEDCEPEEDPDVEWHFEALNGEDISFLKEEDYEDEIASECFEHINKYAEDDEGEASISAYEDRMEMDEDYDGPD